MLHSTMNNLESIKNKIKKEKRIHIHLFPNVGTYRSSNFNITEDVAGP